MNWIKINNIIFVKFLEGKVQLKETDIQALARGRSEDNILQLIRKVTESRLEQQEFKDQMKETRKVIKDKLKHKFSKISFNYNGSGAATKEMGTPKMSHQYKKMSSPQSS